MKTFFTLLFVVFTSMAFSQARRTVLIEHFTQASCAPCASQNPIFESSILDENEGNVCHISYHTSWPGVDPMNALNPADVAERVAYYNVSGVPQADVLGNKWEGGPAGITQTLIDDLSSSTSPLRVGVSETTVGATRNVSIDVKTEGALPMGSYVLYAAVVERSVTYAIAPGSNGEKRFLNVFRDFLTAPNGTPFAAAAVGSSASSPYTYTVPGAWDLDSVYVIAWVQNTTTKEVINCGSTFSPKYELTNTSTNMALLGGATASAFNCNFTNLGTTSGNFRIKLEALNMPSDWSKSFNYNSTVVADSIDVASAGLSSSPMVITITPGLTPAVVTIKMIVQNLDDPTYDNQVNNYYMIANVKELVMSNSNGLGDGSGGSADDFSAVYTTALQAAGATCSAKGDRIAITKLSKANALTNVKAIYYNIGWTFPSFDDELITELTTFVNAGGRCLFIAGQDVCWDVFETTGLGNGTPAQAAFLKNTMKVNYVADGSAANNQLTVGATDPTTVGLSPMTISPYYGAASFFPDELGLEAGGTAIFNYNSGTKIAGVRSTDVAANRTVYIAPGMEMFTQTNANSIIKNVHDFFFADGDALCGAVISTLDDDEVLMSINNNIPNPCDASTTIAIDATVGLGCSVEVIDAMGKLVYKNGVQAGENHLINTKHLAAGLYVYRLVGAGIVSQAGRMQVIH